MRATTLRKLSRICSFVLIAAVCLYAYSSIRKTELPPAKEILPRLLDEPLQEEIRARPFQLEHEGTAYTVHPVADYEIAGLVVTHNDINAFTDIYHSGRSVDLKDLCMIWGENLHSDDFRRVQYWSEPWSCHYQYKEDVSEFHHDALSNTHVLVSSPSVRKKIQEVQIGDQIFLRGQLINYAPTCCSEQLRSSSLVRDDTGNGACEVMYVTEAEILKHGNPTWHQLYSFGKLLFWTFLVCKIALFLWITYAEVPRIGR